MNIEKIQTNEDFIATLKQLPDSKTRILADRILVNNKQNVANQNPYITNKNLDDLTHEIKTRVVKAQTKPAEEIAEELNLHCGLNIKSLNNFLSNYIESK